MKTLDVKQGTSQWFAARAGLVTGSKAADMMSFLKKGGESAARANYKAQIVAELLTGEPEMGGYLSSYMEWGNEQEQFARAAYEVQTGAVVDTVGLVLHSSIERMGGSPDGIVGEDGGLEIKCPKTTTHIKWIIDGVVPEEHRAQMYFYMACTGRAWWDFASFDPRLPDPLQLFVKRLARDEEKIAEIEDSVAQFNREVDEQIAQLKALVGEFPIGKPKPEYPAEEGFLTEEDFYGLVGK